MSLPACQRRILDSMDDALQAGDPHLAAMFAIFARLNAGEPVDAEQVARRAWLRWPQPGTATYAVVLIPVVFALIVIGALFGGAPRGARICEAGYTATSSSPLVNRPLCEVTGNAAAVNTTWGTTSAQTAADRTASGAAQTSCTGAAQTPRSVAWTGSDQAIFPVTGTELTTAGSSGACLE
jgi:hypothetical protein